MPKTNRLDRRTLLPETELPSGAELLAIGRKLQSTWSVGNGLFQREFGVQNEIEHKLRAMRDGRIMQHAQTGYRSIDRTCDAMRQIHDACLEQDVRVDRFGVCLDWSMGFPRKIRKGKLRGTGVLLDGPEDFQLLTEASPSAVHFGDFMLGFPGALENTCAAIVAGATTIGNLGQYFSFRLPHYQDDVETTVNTVKALGLIAAQPVSVLVHSNLDDGFAAVFKDLTSAIGMAMVEKYIVSDLIGAKYAVCYGHHFTEPLTRIAFQRALSVICEDVPGSQIYGATVLYKGDDAANYASLSSYLLSDILAQMSVPTGHAVNPVPVTENKRIPDVGEVVDAQLNLGRLSELAEGYLPLIDFEGVEEVRDRLLAGGRSFADTLLSDLSEAGINCSDPFELLLCLRRIGGRGLETLFGVASRQEGRATRFVPVVAATTYVEIEEEAKTYLKTVTAEGLRIAGRAGYSILTATTDVHEHGKALLDTVFSGAGIEVVDGGVSSDPEVIVELAKERKVNAIALSTYNGVALTFTSSLLEVMRRQGLKTPVLVGGRLNQVPESSNSGLPADVTQDLKALGVFPCKDLDAAVFAIGRSLEG